MASAINDASGGTRIRKIIPPMVNLKVATSTPSSTAYTTVTSKYQYHSGKL